MINWAIYFSIFIIILLITLFIYFSLKKNKSFSQQNFTLGTFKKIYGDINQPPLFQNIKLQDSIKIIYLNNSNKIIDTAYIKKNKNIDNNGVTDLKRHINNPNITVEVTNGFAKEKFARINLNYNATHTYQKFKKKVYYQNIYYFSNGDISFALYQKI